MGYSSRGRYPSKTETQRKVTEGTQGKLPSIEFAQIDRTIAYKPQLWVLQDKEMSQQGEAGLSVDARYPENWLRGKGGFTRILGWLCRHTPRNFEMGEGSNGIVEWTTDTTTNKKGLIRQRQGAKKKSLVHWEGILLKRQARFLSKCLEWGRRSLPQGNAIVAGKDTSSLNLRLHRLTFGVRGGKNLWKKGEEGRTR